MVAHQVTITLRVLADENVRRIAEGAASADLHPEAVAAAERAFEMLRSGIGDTFA